jgi:hypothetical protein
MTVIDARSTFDVRRAETEADHAFYARSAERAMAIHRMVTRLRKKGHPNAELAASLHAYAEGCAARKEEGPATA